MSHKEGEFVQKKANLCCKRRMCRKRRVRVLGGKFVLSEADMCIKPILCHERRICTVGDEFAP